MIKKEINIIGGDFVSLSFASLNGNVLNNKFKLYRGYKNKYTIYDLWWLYRIDSQHDAHKDVNHVL